MLWPPITEVNMAPTLQIHVLLHSFYLGKKIRHWYIYVPNTTNATSTLHVIVIYSHMWEETPHDTHIPDLSAAYIGDACQYMCHI